MARLNQAARQGGPRGTKVARTPYWRPDINEWVLIPTGVTHRQHVEVLDPETDEVQMTMDQYQAKGWMPLFQIPEGDPRRKLLPENYGEMMRDHKARPKPLDEKVVAKAHEDLGLAKAG